MRAVHRRALRFQSLALPRGVVVQGAVVEKASGKPVAGASVEFTPRQGDNPHYRRDVIPTFWDLRTIALSGAAALVALLVFARSATVREYRLSQAMPASTA